MRRTNTQPIAEVLQEYIRALKIQGKLDEVKVREKWNEMMGPTIANSTRSVVLHNRSLVVQLNSSVIRNELMMMQTQIIERLNESLGQNLVERVVLK